MSMTNIYGGSTLYESYLWTPTWDVIVDNQREVVDMLALKATLPVLMVQRTAPMAG